MACAVEFRVNLPDPLAYACGLLRTATRHGARLLVTAPRPTLDELDLLLWTRQPGSFIPHVWIDDALAAQTPVLLADAPEPGQAGRVDALVNFGPGLVPGWDALPRVIELVGEASPERIAGRDRLRAYRAAGYDPRIIKAGP